MINTTIGIYPNDYVINGVRDEDLEAHIEYNKTMRPARALIVNGKTEYNGSFTDEQMKALEDKYRDVKATKFSTQYH